MRKNIALLFLLFTLKLAAQENKCILYSDSGKTEVTKTTCSDLSHMKLLLKVPVFKQIKDYWYMEVKIESNYTFRGFVATFEKDSMQNMCDGKDFIYLTFMDTSLFSDFHCTHHSFKKEKFNYNFFCSEWLLDTWYDKAQYDQILTVTVTYLGDVLSYYNGSAIYDRKEFSNQILEIIMH